jgi:hypothetical protein
METKSYLKIDGDQIVEVNHELIRSLRKSPMPTLSEHLDKAVKVAARHGLGLLLALDSTEGTISYMPMDMGSERNQPLDEGEAIALAVELHHIFRNNANVCKWPVKLAKGCTAYAFRKSGAGDAEFSTIILNRQGYFYTSYNPVENKFFPEVNGISTKPLDKEYPHMLDELNNMYARVRKNIKVMRNEESDDTQKEETGGVVGK